MRRKLTLVLLLGVAVNFFGAGCARFKPETRWWKDGYTRRLAEFSKSPKGPWTTVAIQVDTTGKRKRTKVLGLEPTLSFRTLYTLPGKVRPTRNAKLKNFWPPTRDDEVPEVQEFYIRKLRKNGKNEGNYETDVDNLFTIRKPVY